MPTAHSANDAKHLGAAPGGESDLAALAQTGWEVEGIKAVWSANFDTMMWFVG